jgi:hypothetical protein
MTNLQLIQFEGKDFYAYTEASDALGKLIPGRTHKRVVCLCRHGGRVCSHDRLYKTQEDLKHAPCVYTLQQTTITELAPTQTAPQSVTQASRSTIYDQLVFNLCVVVALSNISLRQVVSAPFVDLLRSAMFLQRSAPQVSPDDLLREITRNWLTLKILELGKILLTKALSSLCGQRVSIIIDAATVMGKSYKVVLLVAPSTALAPVLIELDQSPGTRLTYVRLGVRAVAACWLNGIIPAGIVTDGLPVQVGAYSFGGTDCIEAALDFLPFSPLPLHAPCLCHRIQLGFYDAQFLSTPLANWVEKIKAAADELRLAKTVQGVGATSPTYVSTRWVYVTRILEFIAKHKEAILSLHIPALDTLIPQLTLLIVIFEPLRCLLLHFEADHSQLSWAFALISQACLFYDQLQTIPDADFGPQWKEMARVLGFTLLNRTLLGKNGGLLALAHAATLSGRAALRSVAHDSTSHESAPLLTSVGHSLDHYFPTHVVKAEAPKSNLSGPDEASTMTSEIPSGDLLRQLLQTIPPGESPLGKQLTARADEGVSPTAVPPAVPPVAPSGGDPVLATPGVPSTEAGGTPTAPFTSLTLPDRYALGVYSRPPQEADRVTVGAVAQDDVQGVRDSLESNLRVALGDCIDTGGYDDPEVLEDDREECLAELHKSQLKEAFVLRGAKPLLEQIDTQPWMSHILVEFDRLFAAVMRRSPGADLGRVCPSTPPAGSWRVDWRTDFVCNGSGEPKKLKMGEFRQMQENGLYVNKSCPSIMPRVFGVLSVQSGDFSSRPIFS